MLLSSVSMRKLEAWERRKTRRTQAFHILVFSRCEGKQFIAENNLLLSLLRNGSSLIYAFVFWRFYKVLSESIVLF